MGNLLRTEITQPEFFGTAAGRFLEPYSPVPTVPESPLTHIEPTVLDILEAQKVVAAEALARLYQIQQQRITVETANSHPDLVHPKAVDHARGLIEDWGTLWRRYTDFIANTLATQFPNQQLGHLLSAPGRFYTTAGRLHEDGIDGNVSAYSSLLNPEEYRHGILPASEDQWHDLLFRVTLL